MKTTRRGLFGWLAGASAAATGMGSPPPPVAASVVPPPIDPPMPDNLELLREAKAGYRTEYWKEYVRNSRFAPHMGKDDASSG